jgi:ATP-dependent metalloprotease FtsH
MVCGFYRLRNSHPGVHRGLLESFNRDPEGIYWPDVVQTVTSKTEELRQDSAVPDNMPFDSELQRVMDRAYRMDPSLPALAVFKAILNSEAAIAIELRTKNPIPLQMQRPPISAMVQQLDMAAARSAELRERLGRVVLGQDRAIEMLGNGFFEACLTDQGRGPRGIFTFLGPQGVGKTLMAEAFARAISDLEGGKFAFKRFDMGLYASWSDFPLLYGAGSEPGELTGFVNANPNCVLLFDEIEKGLPALIQSFLPMLDSGEVYDKALKRAVNFRGAWIIFTTNLGREYFDKTSPLGVGAAVSAEAFDLLASAKARTEIKDEEAVPVLSPEFVSRISKGGAVIFSRLEARHLLELVEHGLQVNARTREETARVFPPITADLDAQVLFLLSLLPNLEPRKAAARGRAWSIDIVRGAHAQLREELTELEGDEFSIHVSLGPKAKTFLSERLAKATQNALLIDEDLRTHQLLEPRLAEIGTNLLRCTGIENLEASLEQGIPGFILLDLSIHKGPSSSEVDHALAILENLRTKHTDIPIYVFSENPDRRAAFASIAERIMRKGGARDYIPYFRNSGQSVLEESFISRVREIAHSHRLEVLIRNQERSHVQVNYQPTYRLDFHRRLVIAELDNATEAVVVSAGDHAGGIGFSGIPKERLKDVIGLERAKDGLKDVLSWIQNPRSLRKMGGDIPRGYLLAGPPGCGKTMLARAFAGEAKLPFLGLSGSELSSQWYGNTEKKIREIFELAQKYAPAIIFIDEIESIAPDRGSLPDEVIWMAGIVNQLLVCMDGFRKEEAPVFILAATNNPERIDPALRRPGRLDKIIPIDLPHFKARLSFFQERLKKVPQAESVDIEDLAKATVGRTPAYLDRLVREAVYQAAKAGREQVTKQDFLNAKHLVLYGADLELDVSREELELTAHHEAGHAIARMVLSPSRQIDLITISPNENGSLGFVASHSPENQHSLTLQEVENDLVALMAGREAERLLRSDKGVTTGARSDLEKATQLATQAVAAWGFDEQIGPMVVGQSGGSGGIDLPDRVREMLKTAQKRAQELLKANNHDHALIVKELLEQQHIQGSELQALIKSGRHSEN